MAKRIQWWGRIGGGSVGRMERGGPKLFQIEAHSFGRGVVLFSELPGQESTRAADEIDAKALAQKLLDEFVKEMS